MRALRNMPTAVTFLKPTVFDRVSVAAAVVAAVAVAVAAVVVPEA